MIIAFYTGRLGRAAVKRDWLDGLFGGVFSMATAAMSNAQQYGYSRKMARYNFDLAQKASKYNQEIQQENALFAKDVHDQSLLDNPKLIREGLEMGGYNPILGVNAAAGSPFSTNVSSAPGSSNASFGSASSGMQLPKIGLIDTLKSLADIESTRAQTKLTERRTESEGWQVKTLSRSEASGLGVNLLHTLGINLHESDQSTFLVAYNPITGELRNLGDSSRGIGSLEPSNAAEVKAIPVDWSKDGMYRYRFNPDDWELKPEYRK